MIARYTNAEHAMGEFVRPNGQETSGQLPPNAGDIRAEFDTFLADGGVVESYIAPPAPTPQIAKSVITARLIAAGKIDAAVAAIMSDPSAFARWVAPDKPVINADDPEAVAMIKAIGADPAAILATD